MNTFKDIGTVHVLRIDQMFFQDQYQGKRYPIIGHNMAEKKQNLQ